MNKGVGDKVCIGEPAFKVGSLFVWNTKLRSEDMPPFIITDITPLGMQQRDTDPVVWEWQYQLHYLHCPVKTTFKGESAIKSLIRATELQLISEGDNRTT